MDASLQSLSDAMADAVATAGAGTVTVDARRGLPATGIAWAPDLVLTCDHVIDNDDDTAITVVSAGGAGERATLVGRDPGTDLALLRLPGATLTPLGREAPLPRTGNLVLALGRPRETGPMASLGVVSGIGGPWRTFRGTRVEGFLQTDVTMLPGFSGGPLIDASGRMLGLNSSRLNRGGGLTLPNAALAPIVESLLGHGRIRRGYLGISTQPVALAAAAQPHAGGRSQGLLIVNVEADSPAERGGMLVGDILVGINGHAVEDAASLQTALGSETVGAAAMLAVVRGGKPEQLSTTIGERP